VTIFNMHVSLLIFISFAMLSVAVKKAEATRAADLAAAKAKDEKEAFFKPGDGDADDAQSISQQVERYLKRGYSLFFTPSCFSDVSYSCCDSIANSKGN
jgi:hypothetical protein